MGRLLALILGGIGIVLYGPLFLPEGVGTSVTDAVTGVVGEEFYRKLYEGGAGILAALALILFAVRGRD